MGFFGKGTASVSPATLSRPRVKLALEAEGWSYQVDSDGDIGGGWEFGTFWFLFYGKDDEILQVRGTWDGRLDPARLAEVERFAAEWNREKLFPKVYPRVADDGTVRVLTEHSLDYEFGVTDEQLRQHVLCGVNTGCAVFTALNEAFPGSIPTSS